MERGRISRIIQDRGFGFVKRENREPDIFLLYKALPSGTRFDKKLEGRIIEFEAEQTEKGLRVAFGASFVEEGA